MTNIELLYEEKAEEWLLKIPLPQWARHACRPEGKSEHMTNNMSKSFNSLLGRNRSLQIVKLLDASRQKCMHKLHKRFARGSTWQGKPTLKCKDALNNLMKMTKGCRMIPSNTYEFEVWEGKIAFAVVIGKRTCLCKWWETSGLPCKHACLALGYKRANIEEYCNEYFTVEAYLKTYKGVIHTIPRVNLESETEGNIVLPLELKRKVGRPKKN
ncbi:uncharacterized protein LOC105628310 [Jatropha curcas]|uniref:uncharacterized protein LOC105628310 n=1 Tax=Jatropha curcas TaxID=180498 RepID=UPI0005FC1880|nr:uncharacterized protein LOC105628310 [Jatropha curcas]